MRSRGRALIQHDRCIYKGRTQTHAEGRPCEDAGRRLPSVPLAPSRVSSVPHLRALPPGTARGGTPDPPAALAPSQVLPWVAFAVTCLLRPAVRSLPAPSSGRCLQAASTVRLCD